MICKRRPSEKEVLCGVYERHESDPTECGDGSDDGCEDDEYGIGLSEDFCGAFAEAGKV